MKSKILLITIILLSAITIWTACKKDNSSDSNPTTTDVSTQSATQASDQSMVTNEIDNVTNDINSSIEVSPSLTGNSISESYHENISTNAVISVDSTFNGVHLPSLCGATITYDTSSNNKNVTITYSGISCNGKTSRSGVVKYSIPVGTKWKTAGAALTVTYQNYKVVRLIDNKSIIINGNETFTNVSGGLLINLATLKTVTHSITSGGLNVVFTDSTGTSQQGTWQISKQRVYTYNGSILITTTGTYSDNSVSGIAEWGTNRYGNSFTTAITQPIIEDQGCDFRITGGQVQQVQDTKPKITVTTTFGLDSTGNPTSCPGTGNYYMSITWTYANQSYTKIKPY